MEPFLNKKYVLVSSENFDDYLVYLGVGYLARKVAVNLKAEQCLRKNDDGTYTFDFISKFANSSIVFLPGVEFDEVKPDGVKVKSTVTIEDNKMIHVQVHDNGKVAKHVREFFPDKLVITTTARGWDKTATRTYELKQ